jgi:hypothetical protein
MPTRGSGRSHRTRVLTEGAGLSGLPLYVCLKRHRVSRVDCERWWRALQEDPRPSAAGIQRLYKLGRALARH